MKEEKYDFFISHASEDKDNFVRPLAEELKRKGFSVWYDENSLRIGDSLIKSIGEGIRQSYYAIVVLSKNFFCKNWTRKELDALLSRELLLGEDIILPIWHDISTREVYDFSPLLIDKFAINSKGLSIEAIIDRIQARVPFSITTSKILELKISELQNFKSERRKKEAVDIIYRMDKLFLYEEATSNLASEEYKKHGFNSDVGDLISIKDSALKKEYGIPNSVYTKSEPYGMHNLIYANKLCRKWVNQRMSNDECTELMVLLDDFMDTDYIYILYGFPMGTIKDKDVFKMARDGFYAIGNKNNSRAKARMKLTVQVDNIHD